MYIYLSLTHTHTPGSGGAARARHARCLPRAPGEGDRPEGGGAAPACDARRPGGTARPLPREHGTDKTAKAIFWPSLSGSSLLEKSFSARKRITRQGFCFKEVERRLLETIQGGGGAGEVCSAFIAGLNRRLQALDLCWRSTESGALWYTSMRSQR